MSVRHSISLIVALFSSAVVLSPCSAQSNTAVVSYADLDLTSPAGRSVLAQRIQSAAAKVCDTGSRDLRVQMAIKECRRSAERKAIARIPIVTAAR